MADVTYINFDEGVKRMMNKPDFYIKMLNKFKADDNLKGVETAMTAQDMEKAQVAVHTLKGLAGNLSLTELFNQSLELETQIKARAVNPDQFAALKNIYAQTLTEIEKVIVQYG